MACRAKYDTWKSALPRPFHFVYCTRAHGHEGDHIGTHVDRALKMGETFHWSTKLKIEPTSERLKILRECAAICDRSLGGANAAVEIRGLINDEKKKLGIPT